MQHQTRRGALRPDQINRLRSSARTSDPRSVNQLLDVDQPQRIYHTLASNVARPRGNQPLTYDRAQAEQRRVSMPHRESLPASAEGTVDAGQIIPHKLTHGPRMRRVRLQRMVLTTLAAIVFVSGVAVSIGGWRTNRHVEAQVQQITSRPSGAETVDNSGEQPPSTTPVTPEQIRNFAVGPAMPRYIDIGKLKVHARVLSLGILNNGKLATPASVFDAGWYNQSALPGQPGAMLIDGHVSSWSTHGVFYGLKDMVRGDTITITKGDNKRLVYVVKDVASFDADKVDMAALLVSYDTAKPGLNLITCGGTLATGTNEFSKRVVVRAVLE